MQRAAVHIAAAVIIVLVAPQCSAQGLFIERGQNGLGIVGSFWSSEDWTCLSGGFGYSFDGVMDVFGSLGRAEDSGDSGLSAIVFSGGIEGHLLKPSDGMPFGVSVGGSFTKSSYESEHPDNPDWDLESSDIGGFAFAYVALPSSQGLEILPGAGFKYTHSTIEENTGGFFGQETYEEDTTSVIVLVPMAYDLTNGIMLQATPCFETSEDASAFSVSVGVIFPVQ